MKEGGKEEITAGLQFAGHCIRAKVRKVSELVR